MLVVYFQPCVGVRDRFRFIWQRTTTRSKQEQKESWIGTWWVGWMDGTNEWSVRSNSHTKINNMMRMIDSTVTRQSEVVCCRHQTLDVADSKQQQARTASTNSKHERQHERQHFWQRTAVRLTTSDDTKQPSKNKSNQARTNTSKKNRGYSGTNGCYDGTSTPNQNQEENGRFDTMITVADSKRQQARTKTWSKRKSKNRWYDRTDSMHERKESLVRILEAKQPTIKERPITKQSHKQARSGKQQTSFIAPKIMARTSRNEQSALIKSLPSPWQTILEDDWEYLSSDEGAIVLQPHLVLCLRPHERGRGCEKETF